MDERKRLMTLAKFLDPKNDVAFKKIFGTEKNKDILIHFLNDMLVFKEQKPIVDVSFLKTMQDPEISSKKTSVVDVLCTDQDKNTYVVEMQVASHKGFEKRAQYYAAKAYVSQMNRGGQYENLKEVIFLAIANFTMFPEKKSYKSDHIILDRENHQHDLKDFSFTFLELEKFTKAKDQLSSIVEKWVYFFKHAQETTPEDLEMVIGQDSVIKRAYEELDRFYWKEEELFAYEDALKKDMDYEASMDKKFDEGMKAAFVKVAKNMLKQGLSIQNIASATGLSAKEVKKIQEEIKKSSI
jgi:predicted transposase/invertase (TIGR01784 family)